MISATIFNKDCMDVLPTLDKKSIDIVLTSPPYNTARKTMSATALEQLNQRYDIHIDDMTDSQYIEFTINIFNEYNQVLKEDGVVLYNLSYSTQKPSLMWSVVSEIINKTNFTVADTIVWKKSSALPNNMSHNRLTRIVEFVFVFCRKDELSTFKAAKEVISTRKTGQRNYENVFNFVEARNNDGSNQFNKATFSTELCDKLLKIYANPSSVVLDNFMGTGTTGVSSLRKGCSFIGIEIS